MRSETYTFELRDNDTVIRELSASETNEVTGGIGNAAVAATAHSGAGSAAVVGISAALVTSNTTAAAAIVANISAVGLNNTFGLAAAASVT